MAQFTVASGKNVAYKGRNYYHGDIIVLEDTVANNTMATAWETAALGTITSAFVLTTAGALDGAGLLIDESGAYGVRVDATTVEVNNDILRVKALGIDTAQLALDAVDKTIIAADVAGSGLGQNVDGSLEVKVDDTTVEINTDTLRVKALGIDTAQLALDAADKTIIAADVAGTGLAQNVDGSLEINVDDVTVEVDGVAGLQVKALGIDTAQLALDSVDKTIINADVAGNGLGQNVDGSLEVKVDDTGIEIDTDTLRLKDLGVGTAKIADAAITGVKLAGAALGMLGFGGVAAPGPCACVGAGVGDVVVGVINLTDMAFTSTSVFEGVITVVDQIQQVSADDLSTKAFAVWLKKA